MALINTFLLAEYPALWLVKAQKCRQAVRWSVLPWQSRSGGGGDKAASSVREPPALLSTPPRINVAPLRSKLKQFFHRVPAILIFTWRGHAEDTLAMMKDIFPFSQLGHALTHHYPIDLIHAFPSSSPCLPSSINSLPPSISSASVYIYL